MKPGVLIILGLIVVPFHLIRHPRQALSLVRRAWRKARHKEETDAEPPLSLEVEEPSPTTSGVERVLEAGGRVRELGISTAARHSGSKPKGRRQPKKGKPH